MRCVLLLLTVLPLSHAKRHTDCQLNHHYPVIAGFSPLCEKDGSYSARQCFHNRCWCVYEDGVEIEGTDRSKRTKKPDCSKHSRSIDDLSVCQKKRHDLLIDSESTGLVGRFVPSCLVNGLFQPKQCHPSTGHCWCVNTEGEEMEGTRRTSSENPAELDCSAPAPVLTSCQMKQHQASFFALLGLFSPSCEQDGSYSSKQCHGSSGHCWCVRRDGTEIEGSRRAPADNASDLDCSAIPPLTACEQERVQVLGSGLLGSFAPVCEKDGSYAAKQCHASTGDCWCVDSNGVELKVTHRTRNNRPAKLFCAAPASALTACQHKRSHTMGSRLIGSFVPSCQEDGSYSPKQCHASSGHCWCVNANGEEIQGTRVPPSDAPNQFVCPAGDEQPTHLTACQQQRQHTLLSELVGAFLPSCEANGNYSTKQCHASTGHCWCVHTDGNEIEGTRRMPTENPAELECSGPTRESTPCELSRLHALSSNAIGAFVPMCEQDGSYSAKQCHSSTGHCWCVLIDGNEIKGSRRTASETQIECGDVRATVSTTSVQSRVAEDHHRYGLGMGVGMMVGCVCVALVGVVVGVRRRKQVRSGVAVAVPYSRHSDV